MMSEFLSRKVSAVVEGQNIFDFKEFNYYDFKEALGLIFIESGYKEHYEQMIK